jgi:hypothetical protein
MRTEIPMPIWADDVVDSDNTEADKINAPNTKPDTTLRIEFFI